MNNNKPLYKPFKSKVSGKKYSVYVMKNNKKTLIHFGDSNMQHFKDKIGEWSSLDHNDKERRKSYRSRSGGIKNKRGELTAKDKNSANYWSRRILW
jgi:hypothetical protein